MKIRRAPTKPPPFTLGDIKQKIPDHCFERSTLRSSAYLVFDLAAISLLVYVSTWIDSLPVLPFFRWTVFWPLYWFTCGAVATGVWVIGHECGHGAFSKVPAINDFVGFVFHSLLLVPYFSWYLFPFLHIYEISLFQEAFPSTSSFQHCERGEGRSERKMKIFIFSKLM